MFTEIGGAVGSIWGPAGTAIGTAAGAALDGAYQHNQNQSANAREEYYAKHRLQWMAEDARSAGIHPLAALGGQTYTPSYTSGANIQGNVGASIRGAQAFQQRQAELELQRSQNEAEKAHWESVAARNAANANSSPAVNITPPQVTGNLPGGWRTDKSSADSQTYEDRYWEFGGAYAGIKNMILDAIENAKDNKPRVRQRTRRYYRRGR